MSGDRSHKQPSDGTLDPCVYCGRPTAFGHGLFVNRIPADADDDDGNRRTGYACSLCTEQIGYWGINDGDGWLCMDCGSEGINSPLYADDIDEGSFASCGSCQSVMFDWTNWNDA